MNPAKKRDRVIVFDVNETLLDIDSLKPFFKQTFGDEDALRQWFGELILYSQALTLSGTYMPFGQLAVAVLGMVAEIRGLPLAAGNVDEFKERMANLPAHDDAAPALGTLREAGFRLVTLTNSAPGTGTSTLDKAGLALYFEQQFSVHAVQRFKPALETYRSVSTALGTEASSLRLVAAHSWDTLGAMAAGWKAALVARAGNAALSVGAQPDIIEKDLRAIATRIIGADA
ncbi:MAG: haloacid dehalogenase type II [Rhodanobacter sp.]|nr:MAG: haloacid dehalogenase type II [Rhodanobacter sp.]TAM04522.1 MAG: haloacid dehalogenase type II [Rhodanobacter sp.]TAM40911.1 MAG: haloacid dehalogenase type II [Rhodanobacter sp.]TAN25689.1 MAG: haloacid dehalogenase type II [Rhodanobacter sp.]